MSRVGTAGALALVLLFSCSSSRDEPPPAAATTAVVTAPSTLGPEDAPYVDALEQNFTEGVDLTLVLDAEPAACVAERWISILGRERLERAGLSAPAMAEVTLDRINTAVPLDRATATSLTGAVTECGARYESAFLNALFATGEITPRQRTCLADRLPDDLVEAITISILVDGAEAVDEGLSAQFDAALDGCVG